MPYPIPQALAHALQAAAPLELSLLPHNPYRPDVSTYWLLPRLENPAHHRAKFAIWPTDPETLFVGWGVEKGVGPATQGLYPPKLTLGWHWAWHQMLDAALNGALDRQLRRARQQAQEPLSVWVSMGQVPPRGGTFDPHGGDYRGLLYQRTEWTYDRFLHAGQEVEATLQPDLPFLHQVCDVADQLPQTQNYDWVWMDFYLGLRIPRATPLDAREIYERALSAWEAWL